MKVILIMAMTLDGKIARHSMEPVDWTGKADKRKFVEITKKAGAVIMGSATFDTIGQTLKGRKNIVMTRNRSRLTSFSIDRSNLQTNNSTLSFNSNSLDNNNESLEFTDKTPHEILKSLEDEGFDSVALIGGSTINGLFARENLIDEVYITLVPKLFGQGLSLLSGELDMNLELIEMDKIDNNSILLKYNVIK
ncbi:MAG: dihydrofolate reductase [Desulfamplus sp.]|nr:dihydrofolate reductase [Desulfamplus sp.]